MCGITGILNLNPNDGEPIQELSIRQMLATIRHRGPDQFGIYMNQRVALGSARLSIIDLSTGQQPISNEDDTLWIVFNGEIFNYIELRPELEKKGHQFKTTSDTEIILHLYEDYGVDCLKYLNGQFAIAIWNTKEQSLFLARDRIGIRTIFYTFSGGSLIFGSEIKSILASGRVQAELDPIALDEIFTFWSTLSPRTVFKGIHEIPPGHFLLTKGDDVSIQEYWRVQFPPAGAATSRALQEYLDEFEGLLIDSTKIRLRADVPVGAYLSGGLDSSTTSAIIRNYTSNRLDTFSIAFSDPAFDESQYQQQMAKFLGTDHQVVYADYADIGQAFINSIWHTETPVLRTSPAPLYLLSELVRQNNYKVVLTGEGADEFLAGYNIFKEASIRRFWARNPSSQIRPLLLKRLYPYIADLATSGSFINAFFGEGLTNTELPYYSHAIRWRNTSRTKRFFSSSMQSQIEQVEPAITRVYYPPEFSSWDVLNQAQYLEISIFLAQYLLSSQGDRVAMAHSVEGRFPFLDYRVVEFCNQLPPHLKLKGLTEKYLLRRLAQKWLPAEIYKRPKRPYRAPIHRSFFAGHIRPQTLELLSPAQVSAAGYFKPGAVGQLVNKAGQEGRMSETDDMALAGILSTQLVHKYFIQEFKLPAPITQDDDVKVIVQSGVTNPL